ncbi:30S ribosomal protein S8e [Methanocella paludicola SANAE]|uniref:Small ribosomal subunit protein eS8 n=1 Tax=Methanocella paludicola (strain DSM 17711 / JCM 13418 / NBRC 101707 / SANAE) TaxID=304371 RepID=D1YZP9_METPS|nr:30S ribosomal protein S8e [Methanocella paludicola]BAI61921.1 30S ribosomal protein S8e [Methanocella paludicola SANAE]
MKSQGKSIRKPTGGRLRPNRGKRKFELGSEITQPVIGATSRKVLNVMGNGSKVKVLKENVVNVTDPKSGKTQKAKMTTEVENPANKNYVRRNILTKGAVVMTELGKAKITSRPGQDGEVNAVLISE